MELQELEYDHTLYEDRYKGDDKLYVRFYTDIVPDIESSVKTGIRKFREANMIQIMVPGSKTNVVVREVRTTENGAGDDDVRFAKQYRRFIETGSQAVDGFPLKDWPLAHRAMAEELKYLGFVTVEQVAKAGDAAMSKYPGLRELAKRAQVWLEAQAGAAPLEKLQNELAKRDEQLAAMQAQIDALMVPKDAAKAK